MSRPRKQGSKDLPPNLYSRSDTRAGVTYFNYRDIRTGQLHSLGSDKKRAIQDANALNAAIYESIKNARMAAILTQKPASESMSEAVKRHLELSEKRGLASNTMRSKKGCCNVFIATFGDKTRIGAVTVREFAELLNRYDDKPRMRQTMRAEGIDLWATALQEGWADENIPDKTRTNSAKVKRSRLTLEAFTKIHEAALKMKAIWVARSMELALVTAQRESDIAALNVKKFKESTAWLESDALCVCQIKSQGKNKLRIPLDIGVNGWTVGGVLKSCRDNIVSQWVVHQNIRHGGASPGQRLTPGALSRGFAEARDLAGIEVEEGQTPPTFHEIRSLSIRLYSEKYGEEFAQALAGHKDSKMTAIYRDVRGSEWVQVKAG